MSREMTGEIEFVSRGQVAIAPTERRNSGGSGGVNRAQHRLNGAIAVALMAMVALAPLPLGSTRPVLWLGWTMLVALLGLVYGAVVIRVEGAVRATPASFAPETVLMLAFLGFEAFQMAPLGGFLGLVPASASITLDPGSTVLTAIVTAGYMLFFFLFAQVAGNRRRARRILMALFLVVVAYAILGLVSLTQWNDTLLGFEKQYYRGVATGSFVNRNSYATFLASGLAMGAPLLVSAVVGDQWGSFGRRLLVPLLVLVGMGFIAAALFATGSRMGTFAGIAGALLGLLAGALAFRGSKLGKVMIVVVVAAAAVALALVFGAGLIERVIFAQNGDSDREALWSLVWSAILERPWLGYGAGSFAGTFPLFQQPPLNGGNIWSHAHSTYLALWYEHGLVFGSFPLLVIGVLLGRCVIALREPSSTMLSLAALGVGFVFAVHSLVDFSAEIYADALLFIAVLALGAAGARGGLRRGEH